MSKRNLPVEFAARLIGKAAFVVLSAIAGTNAAAQGATDSPPSPDSPRTYLQRMDANGDGRVDEDEYVAYMSRGFASMDTDGNGVLEGDELPPGAHRVTLAQFEQSLRAAFHRQDANHDGTLDAAELSRPPPAR
jgi:hypothetical protein